MRSTAGVLVALVSAAVVVASAGPAAADCAQDDRPLEQQLDEAEYAFVGTATEVTNRGRTATFEVDEVWARPTDGATVGSQVVVHGGPDEPNSASSVERTFETGVRYLVFPHVEDGRFTDDICTPTTTWSEELGDARPATAQEVDGDLDGESDLVATATSTPWIIIGVSVLVGLVAVALVSARRREEG